ncbi:MAG: TIR domain-containing protein [Bacteroidetes bacterium]|nr:TIR domain-containing protein [Bacteroidota bacterium]
MAKVFISFDYQDIEAKKVVDNWSNQNIGLDISLSSEEGHNYLDKGENFVRTVLREKINSSQVVLVLVGNNTHNRPWVDYEIHHAKCQGIKVIWTQIPKTNGAPPKEISKLNPVPFDINSIRTAIRLK